MEEACSSMNGTQTLEVRNLTFATGANVPRHWHGGRRSVTRFLDNLSIFFPEGERFFVMSVQAHRHLVENDPVLKKLVRDFCGQEGIHGREHRRYNEMLREQGLPVDEMERSVVWILKRARRGLPLRTQLAVTAALEHFTALMGHLILAKPALLEGAHPEMAALWRWHAAEENEHKAVAFDVYLKAGGNYAERSVIMLAATAVFWAKVLEFQARMMAEDGDALSAREWARLVRFLFVEPGGMQDVWRLWADWFRPGFHPNDIDSEGAIAAWQASAGA
ncbi:Hypothetical protein I5071_81790 [Sandaracinus amylolyticus]|nr:Hypothetical protein I5071_81790 [Sandaracinus amylolyticus]